VLAGAVRDNLGPAEVELLGPAPSPLARLRGRHRFQLLVKAPDALALQRAARLLVETAATLPEGVVASVDANPTNML
jgi:primosomal protein N' (replication factor Y)